MKHFVVNKTLPIEVDTEIATSHVYVHVRSDKENIEAQNTTSDVLLLGQKTGRGNNGHRTPCSGCVKYLKRKRGRQQTSYTDGGKAMFLA